MLELSIVAVKKKRKTYAIASTEAPSSDQEYHLPPTYDKFLDELKNACKMAMMILRR